MKSIWKADYEGCTILIENTWFSGEKLFVDNQLQDFQKTYYVTPKLTGHLFNRNNERLSIKANFIATLLFVDCVLFVDDKQVALQKIK